MKVVTVAAAVVKRLRRCRTVIEWPEVEGFRAVVLPHRLRLPVEAEIERAAGVDPTARAVLARRHRRKSTTARGAQAAPHSAQRRRRAPSAPGLRPGSGFQRFAGKRRCG
ncbi:MAG: hypothetical protein K2X11_15465 [Acetobacteraceae bacterium]|nr:hypothetical protein [Acetobacteraceae bacterium]